MQEAATARCNAELAACAAARRSRDVQGCLRAARAALQKEPGHGKAWAFLCWSLFELKRFDEARSECLRALGHRNWLVRDREGMAALWSSCRLLSGLTPAVGDRLRDEWYRRRLRQLYDSEALFKYEVVPLAGRPDLHRREGVGRDELSLLDHVSAGRLRDVRLGGDGGEREVPEGLLEGGDSSNERNPLAACFGGDKFPLEQGIGGVVYLKSAILAFHCDRRFGPGGCENRRNCYAGNGPCLSCIRY